MLTPWKESYDQPRQHIKKQRYYIANIGLLSQSYGFSSSQVWMWELDYKESWGPKIWCFWTVVLEKTLESPLNCKIKPVNPKGNQSWIFTGRTDTEAETPILWPPDENNWLFGKDPHAGKKMKAGGEGDDRGWDGWMPSLPRWTRVWASSRSWWWTGKPGMLPGTLACPWGHKELYTAEWLNWPNWGKLQDLSGFPYLSVSCHASCLTCRCFHFWALSS